MLWLRTAENTARVALAGWVEEGTAGRAATPAQRKELLSMVSIKPAVCLCVWLFGFAVGGVIYGLCRVCGRVEGTAGRAGGCFLPGQCKRAVLSMACDLVWCLLTVRAGHSSGFEQWEQPAV
jgi:hypothetical protein